MSNPVWQGGPFPEVPASIGHPDDDFVFVLRRFRRDLERAVHVSMGDPSIEVVFGMAHSAFMSEDMQALGLEAFIDPQTKPATRAAVAVTSVSFAENRVDYSAQGAALATTVVLPGGEVVPATKFGNPVSMYDVRLGIRLFHRDQWSLTKLFRVVIRHFKRHPYLFIPLDKTNPEGDMGENVDLLIARFYRGEDISSLGYVVEQLVNFETEAGTFVSPPNSDNLFVADTFVILGKVPLTDDIDLGTLADIRRIELDLLEKDFPPERVQATITVPEPEEDP